jgi:nucleoside-diphosphate-sugar epimerase
MIGVALVEYCLQLGIEVLAIVRPASRNAARLPASDLLKLIECDLADLDTLLPDDTDEVWDVFFHLGWSGTDRVKRNDPQHQLDNVGYTLAACRLASRLHCRRFVGAGSQAEYGRVDARIAETRPTDPEFAYGIAKDAAARLSRILCGTLSMEHIWARVFSVYGKYDNEGTLVRSTIERLLAGEIPEFTPSGQIWDYLYSTDAGRAFALIGEKGKTGRTYNVGSGKGRQLKEFILVLREVAAPNAELAIGAKPYVSGQVMHLCADITRLTEDTGFTPEIDFRTGVSLTLAWLRGAPD